MADCYNKAVVKAIIFDCFGVLVSERWLAFKREYFGHDKQLSQEATDLMSQADAGLLARDEFVTRIAQMAGIDEKAVHTYLDRNAPNEELFAYIKGSLKPHYKIGMLSNAAADWLPQLFTEEQLALFDATTLSYEAGVTKPDERAYHHIAAKLGVKPEECVFVDDQERHCAGARDAGMQTVYYQDFIQMRRNLEKILTK